MALPLTNAAQAALSGVLKTPNLVLKIEDVPTLYGAGQIVKVARIGDGSVVGPASNARGFYVGANNTYRNQRNIIALDGTSTSIKQTLDPAKGTGSNVSTLSISLMDNGEVTELLTPGEIVDDILQAKCLVYLGFQGTSWPEDYSVVFRGFITDITSDAGKTTFLINGTDERLRSSIFTKATTKLTADLASNATSIPVASIQGMLQPVILPSGATDPTFGAYVRIDNEIIKYTTLTTTTTNGVTSYSIDGLTRGQLNTNIVTHTASASVDTFYRLTGYVVDLALKILASGDTDSSGKSKPFNSLPVSSINIGGPDTRASSFFFAGTVNENDLGLTVGDYITVSGSASPLTNDVSNAYVTNVVQGQTGLFVTVSLPLIDQASSGGTAYFTSQYATLPDGCKMSPDEIDIPQFKRINQLYLNSIVNDFYLKDTIDNAKDFIEQNLYMPVSAYSIPRKSKTSIGYFAGPIPGNDIVTFDSDNIKAPKSVTGKRSTNANFFNEIVYKYDESALEDEYLNGYIGISQSSKNRISNSPNKTKVIEAKGLRSTMSGLLIVQDQVKRRFDRYQYGAEVFNYSSTLEAGYTVEVGDIVVFDGSDLALPDIKTGEKGIAPRLLEIQNKEIQLKSGDLKFTALDTNFSGQGRHALMSPSSFITSGQSTTSFTLYTEPGNAPEYTLWQRLVGSAVQIRSADFATIAYTVLTKADSNVVQVSPALSFTPSTNMIMEFAPYSNASTAKIQKLVYGYMRNSAFADGSSQYTMI